VDYDQAIRLEPDDAEAYNLRGVAYCLSGNRKEGCSSIKRSCELALQYCKPYEGLIKEGVCW
jgi:Flp pilus assembly protein TadD